MQMALLPAKAEPIKTMTKEQSETAGLWFVIAALAFPASLVGAGLLGFLLLREQADKGKFE